MRILVSILSIFACAQSWATWPPYQFASGTFAVGTMSVGSSVPSAPVASAPGDGYEANLFAYYKMDDASAGDADASDILTDSIGAKNFIRYHGANGVQNLFSQPGIIGTALNFGMGYNAFTHLPQDGLSPDLTYWYPQRFSGNSLNFQWSDTTSFSVRFWIKTSHNDGGQNLIIGPADNWDINFGSYAVSDDSKINFEVKNSDFDWQELDSNEAVGDGSWHMVTCWFDHVAGEMGIRIDTNAPATLSSVNMGSASASNGPIGYISTDKSMLLDELGIWKDYALTFSDSVFDYKDGEGRTTPLP